MLLPNEEDKSAELLVGSPGDSSLQSSFEKIADLSSAGLATDASQ